MLANLRLRHIRLELSHGAYIRADHYGKRSEYGLFKTFYGPFERGVCLGYLTSRQFNTLLSSGFISCCYESDDEDAVRFYYAFGGIEV